MSEIGGKRLAADPEKARKERDRARKERQQAQQTQERQRRVEAYRQKREARVERRQEKKAQSKPLPFWAVAVFFALSLPWLEVLLRIADPDIPFFGLGLFRSLLAGGAAGMLLWLVGTLIPQKTVSRWVVGVLLFLSTAIFVIERCCRAFFGAYFQLAFVTTMTGQVAGDFMDTVLMVIWKNLWFFPLALAPFVLFVVFARSLLPQEQEKRLPILQAGAMVALQVLCVVLCHMGGDINYYTYDYSANSTVPRFGLVNTLRLEGQYAIFGMPEEELTFEPPVSDGSTSSEEQPDQSATQSGDSSSSATSSEEDPVDVVVPIVYGDNVMDIDFDTLIAEDSGTLQAMAQYFSGQTPTKQNEYTGLFAGKNLIVLTAESFSGEVIDPELTPTLYRLANEGFVFSKFYQPDWTQSTTGGEFAVTTGIIPTWVGSKTSFSASLGNHLPFTMGWQFRALGYTTTAYHNNSYTYYNRHKTHPNLGYDFYGVGNGLELATPKAWPCSDLEMMEATVQQHIDAYLNEGQLFHTYYMTVSGHCNYGFSVNDMSGKNKEAVAGIEGSETVRAYIACQLELEYALTYLVEALEKAGIADDTVIALAADHYPYAMAEGDTDYYNELTGRNDTERDTSRYHNTLILWSGCMEEPVQVDTPCSAIDIVPTLSNLFGLEYDSRLLSGRDVLAPDVAPGEVDGNMHVVIFADSGYGNSWITAAGTYEASTKTFTPNEGVEVAEDYVKRVTKLVQDRYTYAKYLISQDYFDHIFD